MFFRQLFDEDSWTYTYLIADEESRKAVIIDPVLEQISRDELLIEQLGLTLKYALDTHVHADHITASGTLALKTGCRTGVAAVNNVECADTALKDGDHLKIGDLPIQVIATPGHTEGCLSFLVENHLFTGDALFIRGSGRTDFQNGDAGTLYDSVVNKLFSLPGDTWVYPAHDYRGQTRSTIDEERRFNPRFTLSRKDFIAHMEHLNLPDPKRIMEAVPANQDCGIIAN